MMALWTSDAAAAATGGRVTRGWAASGVSIDTRTLRPGELFVALRDVRDGHDFVAAALAKGAAAALVSRIPEGVAEDAPLLVVPDVLRALEDLGRAARARTRARVVGITGSVGKTSTKEMLRAILGGQGRVHAAEASYNNHWGVPLTLARMPQETEFAVIEIGMNHPGEIAPLARMADLDVAMITTVAPAHLEAFESIEGIAQEKASILDGLRPGGVAVLNADIATAPILRAKAAAVGARVVLFGTDAGADWRILSVEIAGETTVVRATRRGVPILFKVQSPGRHFAANATAALAVAEAMGCDTAISACDIGQWSPPRGRGTRERIVLDALDETGFDLIDDAFNANPASMAAALDVLIAAEPENGKGRLATGRRIAVLGDMLELGPTEADLHAAIARHPGLAAVTVIHCVGPRMRALWQGLPRSQRGQWVETAEELAPRARSLVDAGDIVLVKGSKGSKVSLVVDGLRKLGQAVAPRNSGTE
ncbi:UDP-N-acetylmuramoyl-tripeptide--D-alanyl-D-alanine ligase [Paragemmobacter ruber]|uniref:UDP-N-acetylmuramoyl-tripeptide--D-alanyl-D-alanine ligase n=1 Tax=Paragemmobacter ruber TaxID=1985673 RepID=A0ABW9Y194_9RHOB|nr:UDP-N-acetylmuramoyl-tripeptide--D-alanyl-D-alanine ligase [Rhodobacter ruber]NBE06249.1 UDP-N-acetylmuramoyl-tripeptide--D-alanyl-D-alanine ligase [Rhodobacter ruber]